METYHYHYYHIPLEFINEIIPLPEELCLKIWKMTGPLDKHLRIPLNGDLKSTSCVKRWINIHLHIHINGIAWKTKKIENTYITAVWEDIPEAIPNLYCNSSEMNFMAYIQKEELFYNSGMMIDHNMAIDYKITMTKTYCR